MKKITFFFLLFSFSLFSQVQKLGDLSSGRFIDSRVVFEEGREDIYGYMLLYEFDRKSREVFELEYVLLDRNLNKLTSGTFIEGGYKSTFIKAEVKFLFAKKIKNEIIFGLHDRSEEVESSPYIFDLINSRYRKVNLDKFTLSESFILTDFTVTEKKYKAGDVLEIRELMKNQTLIPTNSDYFLVFAPSEYKLPKVLTSAGKQVNKVKTGVKSFSLLDANMKTVWTAKINGDKKSMGHYNYKGSDKTTLVLQKDILDSKTEALFTFEIYDIASGKLLAEINDKDEKYLMYNNQVEFTDNEVIMYYYLYELKDEDRTYEKSLGYGRIIADKKTGKEIKRDYMLWSNLNPNITFKDKFGKIDKYGKILVQEFTPLNNGNTIVIAEGYNQKSNSEILDLYVMELDKDMKVKYFKKVDKQKNSIKSVDMSGQSLLKYGYFDYYYSQKLDKNGNYVFFYANNEKQGSRSDKRKNPNWVLGIVTYADGEFNYDKLQLTSKGSQIYPGLAKNGYVRLIEVGEKETEIRLEKINY